MCEISEIKSMKERLDSYRNLNIEIDNCVNRLDRLEEKIYNISPSMHGESGSGKGSSSSNSKIQHIIESKEQLTEKMNSLIRYRTAESKAIEEIIEKLKNPDEKLIIYLRYFDNEKWSTISEIMFGSEEDFIHNDNYMKKIFRIHSRALANMGVIGSK